MQIARIALFLLFSNLATPVFGAKLSPERVAELGTRMDSDHATIRRCDEGMASVIAFVQANPKLFTEQRSHLFTFDEKQTIWNTWKRFLEYQLALETIGRAHRQYYKLSGPLEARSFFTGHAAALTQYRYALELLDLVGHSDALDKLLDEEVPEIGLKARGYSSFKFRFLNAGRGIEFAAREVVFKAYTNRYTPENPDRLKAHSDKIWQMGKGRGQAMTAGNAVKVVQKAGFTAWLPVQTGVSEWMGDTKIYRVDRSLITPEQIAELKLQPGDILLERREWYLSNVGLPGFWPHTALYIGTAAERESFFEDPQVQAWVRKHGEASGRFNHLLERSYRDAYQRSGGSEHGHPFRVLEAISEGVTFTTLEHSADADSLAVLRPSLDKVAKAAAIYRAFHYAGRPYDFDFDFDTDASLVCTELVSKAYEPNGASRGLKFPVQMMLGRKVTPANEIVRQFDEQCGTPEQQCELVCFLDGNEKKKRAESATLESFCQSWRRPKWHILMNR